LLISGLVLLLFGQALSFFAWDAAFALGFQEDSLWGIPGVISLICLIANRDFFNKRLGFL
jgi:hypothetical protein